MIGSLWWIGGVIESRWYESSEVDAKGVQYGDEAW